MQAKCKARDERDKKAASHAFAPNIHKYFIRQCFRFYFYASYRFRSTVHTILKILYIHRLCPLNPIKTFVAMTITHIFLGQVKPSYYIIFYGFCLNLRVRVQVLIHNFQCLLNWGWKYKPHTTHDCKSSLWYCSDTLETQTADGLQKQAKLKCIASSCAFIWKHCEHLFVWFLDCLLWIYFIAVVIFEMSIRERSKKDEHF